MDNSTCRRWCCYIWSLRPKPKSKSSQKLATYRSNTSLFGRLYIANQHRNGDPATFFPHENQAIPPSLSDFGKIRIGRKSLLLSCLETTNNQPLHPNLFDCRILDGAAVVHFLKSDTASTFADYSDKIFVPFVFQQLQDATRIDIVWDVYFSKVVQETRQFQRNGKTSFVMQEIRKSYSLSSPSLYLTLQSLKAKPFSLPQVSVN